jgi:enterobactin synthetase component D
VLTPVVSPAVLPEWAAHVSVRVDLAGSESLADLSSGILLPDSLRGAVRKRQIEFLAGRLCAQRAIARLDPSRRNTLVRTLPCGAPDFPSGLVGSITHSAGFVSAAIARTTAAESIGIDSEVITSVRRAARVMRRIATAQELNAAARQVDLDRALAVTLLFSAKESLFKCLYPRVGRVFDYHDARVEVAAEGASGCFCAVVRESLSDGVSRGAVFHGRFEIREGYVHTGLSISAQ